MLRWWISCVFLLLVLPVCGAEKDAPMQVGFAEEDISPRIGNKPVFMAGFGQNRKAAGVRDSLYTRAVVFQHGESRVALVSLDLVGFFNPNVVNVRKQLKGFTHVLVSCTHNHEGPDTLGLWGPNPFTSGIDKDYLQSVEDNIVKAVRQAEKNLQPVKSEVGTASAPELLHDGREPYVKHDELVVLKFSHPKEDKVVGLLVQWNCHPETLDDKNKEISADFVGYTVKYLKKQFNCPVAYFTGTVGGLMTSLKVEVKNNAGKLLEDGTFEKTERYGEMVGELTVRALKNAKPLKLFPIEVRTREVFVPMDNALYKVARQLGVLNRQAYLWKQDSAKADLADDKETEKPLCIKTELSRLRFGDLDIAAFPGEIYPELVLDKVQDPADKNADFPDAPIEPAVYKQMKGAHRMLIGLASDEIGYIIPKRQWDEKKPFCYGRTKSQYGEINSVGPETAPILCEAFKELVK